MPIMNYKTVKIIFILSFRGSGAPEGIFVILSPLRAKNPTERGRTSCMGFFCCATSPATRAATGFADFVHGILSLRNIACGSCRRYGLGGLRSWDSFAAQHRLRLVPPLWVGRTSFMGFFRCATSPATRAAVMGWADFVHGILSLRNIACGSCRRYGLGGLRSWDSFAALRMTGTVGQNDRNGGAE